MPSIANVTVAGKVTAAKENEQSGWINLQGLTNRVPTTVSVGSGTATISTKGVVTFTTVGTNLSINAAFDDSVAHKYRIIYEQTAASTASTVTFLLRDGTPADATTAYDYVLNYNSTTTVMAAATSLNGGSWGPNGLASVVHYITLELSNPAAALATHGFATSSDTSDAGAITYASSALGHRTATAYTGITIKPNTGTITGRVTIMAYQDV